MAALRTTFPHSFQTEWEIDQYYSSVISNKNQTVDGMPDVEWHLKWEGRQSGACRLILNVESESQIKYTVFDQIRAVGQQPRRFIGTSIGQISIQLVCVNADKIRELLMNGRLVFAVNGLFSYSKQSNTVLRIPYAVAQWGLQLKESAAKDFDFVVDDQIIKVHKLLVAAESTVFARMFESENFKEAKENKVFITDADCETVQAAVDYCYRQEVTDYLQDSDKAINLLYFCDKYDFKTLKPLLVDHLSTKISIDNISLLASTAEKTNASKLRHACINFFCESSGFSAEQIAKLDAKFKDDLLFYTSNGWKN